MLVYVRAVMAAQGSADCRSLVLAGVGYLVLLGWQWRKK
jgi:hypothetical protein